MRSRPDQPALHCGMIHPFHVDATRYPVRMRWFLGVAWIVILAKCVLVWWAMNHWHVPIHPAWVVVPTLMLAALATALWIAPHAD
jgi:hypothetical protein